MLNKIVPDATTTWMARGVILSNQTGLGISLPTKLSVSNSLSVSLELPPSIYLREIVTITPSIYQSIDNNEVSLTMRLVVSIRLCTRSISNLVHLIFYTWLMLAACSGCGWCYCQSAMFHWSILSTIYLPARYSCTYVVMTATQYRTDMTLCWAHSSPQRVYRWLNSEIMPRLQW